MLIKLSTVSAEQQNETPRDNFIDIKKLSIRSADQVMYVLTTYVLLLILIQFNVKNVW